MLLTSLAHLTVIDADPLTLIDAALAGGFDAAGIRIVAPFPTDYVYPVVGKPGAVRGIKRRLAETGIQIMDIEAIWLKEETEVKTLFPALDVGQELGAKYVLTVGNDPDRSRLTDNFSALSDAAHQRGLHTMLEFIPYSAVRTLDDAITLLASAKPASAGILVDSLHLSRSGSAPDALAAVDPSLLAYMHLCDARAEVPTDIGLLRAEARERRLFPGEGQLWLPAFVNAFPRGTPISVEAPKAAVRSLPPRERAILLGAQLRTFLETLNLNNAESSS